VFNEGQVAMAHFLKSVHTVSQNKGQNNSAKGNTAK